MIFKTHKTSPLAEINIVPYVDVMLVLLVIFMITAPLMMQGIEVDLPKASAQTLAQDQKPPLVVSVDKEGALYLSSAAQPTLSLAPNLLVTQILAELQSTPGRAVLVKGDKNAEYGKIINAMVLLKQAGISKIGLMTQNLEAKTSQ